jgi:hypothetical protein
MLAILGARPRAFRFVASGVLLVAALLLARDAGAVGTRTFVLDTLDKMSGGDLKGVSVGADGTVRAGFTLGSAPVPDATTIFSALTLADGSTLIGTSPNGKVYRAVSDVVSLFADTGALAVTSIVQDKKGTIFASTMPDGKIFKLSQGKAEPFATLADASHVWALVLDKNGTGLYAGTGPEGKVFHVEANGTSSVYYRSTETHLVSLALAESGDLYAGSSGKGQLYKISGPGRAAIIGDMPGEEVKAIVAAKGGVVWVISNEYGEAPEPPKRSPAAGRLPAGPSTPAKFKPGKGQLHRYDAQGRSERMMKHDDTHYMSLALDDKGTPYVGTGHEGRVYTVDDAHVVSLVADTDERQAGAVFIHGGKGYVATSDPPVFHRILGRGGPDASGRARCSTPRSGPISGRCRGTRRAPSRSRFAPAAPACPTRRGPAGAARSRRPDRSTRPRATSRFARALLVIRTPPSPRSRSRSSPTTSARW